jgi:hypothetical protein
MSKVLVLLAAAPLAACTTDTPVTPLAQYQGATLTLQTANDAKRIEPGFPAATRLTISPPDGDCVRLGDDVTADLDGVRMTVRSRGGAWSSIDETGCDDVAFDLDQVPATTGTDTLLVRDSATTWTIRGVDLFANDFALADAPVAGQRAHITWSNAAAIDQGAYVQFEQNGTVMFDAYSATDVATTGNVIAVALPPGITGEGTLSVNAARTVPATRCDGPASCALVVGAGADLPATIGIAPPNPKRTSAVAVGAD